MAMKLWELLSPSASRVDEVLNRAVDWYWESKTQFGWEAIFFIGRQKYRCGILGPDNKVEIEFFAVGSDDPRGVLNNGLALPVFSTVKEIVTDFLHHNSPDVIRFAGDVPSRVRLYQRFADMMARELRDYKLVREKEKKSDSFVFVKNGFVYESRVDELFDSNGAVHWETDAPVTTAHFNVGPLSYLVMFWDGRGGTNISFMVERDGQQSDTGLTGSGDSFKVFGQVCNIILKYLGDKKPEVFDFQADGSSRIRLYDKLSDQLTKRLPQYSMSTKTLVTGAKSYHFTAEPTPVHVGLKINEDGKIIPNVNTTCDVQPGETERQAAKFGNVLDSKGRPPLLSGSYGDDSARFSANQGDPFYGSDGTRIKASRK